jgi:hypothetical protein
MGEFGCLVLEKEVWGRQHIRRLEIEITQAKTSRPLQSKNQSGELK